MNAMNAGRSVAAVSMNLGVIGVNEWPMRVAASLPLPLPPSLWLEERIELVQ